MNSHRLGRSIFCAGLVAAACGRFDLGGFGGQIAHDSTGGDASTAEGGSGLGDAGSSQSRGGSGSGRGGAGGNASGARGGRYSGGETGSISDGGANEAGSAGESSNAAGGSARGGASGRGGAASQGGGADGGRAWGGEGARAGEGGEGAQGGASGSAGEPGSGGSAPSGPPPRYRSCPEGALLCGTTSANSGSGAASSSLESCCTVDPVPTGDFDFGGKADGKYPTHVTGFLLGRYEVTLERFNRFLADYDRWHQAGAPEEGAGAHPLIVGSGWRREWEQPVDDLGRVGLLGTADEIAAEVNRCMDEPFSTSRPYEPVNCVNWYEAEAFCIWDGGRLPTEREWEYAAAGGDENRIYPWGDEEPDHGRAYYDCQADAETSPCVIPAGGSYPLGNGRFHQRDLAGSVAEWVFDAYIDPPVASCTDCAETDESYPQKPRGIRGGYWSSDAELLKAAHRYVLPSAMHESQQGFRCAYDLTDPVTQ
jgi:formylglycine-generating enzyme required for sulfatase activity